MLTYTEDRYSGARIDGANINLTQSKFASELEEYIYSDNVNNYNKSVVNAVINNHFSKLKKQDIKLKLKVSGGEVYY